MLTANNTWDVCPKDFITIEGENLVAIEPGRMEVTGTGDLKIMNTGGSSASEGGMGSGTSDDRGKGELGESGDKSGNARPSTEDDDKFDPIGKNIKEKEKENNKE